MKKYIFITLVFVVAFSLLLKVHKVLAVTCTQTGNTAYCTNTSTGQTTTYNQYGNNIYGSDGSSYSTYGNTTYGSGSIFNTGGNSGSSSLPLSTAGADLNSPEMIAAKAKYDAACATSSNPNEVIIGGTQASNCQQAVTEWLRALSQSQKTNVSSSNDEYEDTDSNDSTSREEDLDEFMEKMLSRVNSTSSTTKTVDSDIFVCGTKSYLKSDCKNGTVPMCNGDLGLCQSVERENCSTVDSNSFYNSSIKKCQCVSGYLVNKSDRCVPAASWCTETYGVNIHMEGDGCFCNEGYYYDDSSKKCKMDTENIGTSTIETQNQSISNTSRWAEKSDETQTPKKSKWYQRLFNWFF